MFGSGSFNDAPFEDLGSIVIYVSVLLAASCTLSGLPTSNYKSILSETKRRLIYTAEISPWTLSQ
jgi:hypothetical protein